MKIKTKNIKPISSIEHRASSNAFRALCFLFLSFCFLTPLVTAQIQSEQLSPTDLLMPHLEQALRDMNTPAAQTKDAGVSPIDMLMPYLEKALKDMNTPTARTKNAGAGPTDLLLPYLEKALKDMNTPIVQIQDARVNSFDFLMTYLEKTLQDADSPLVQIQDTKVSPVDFLLPYSAQTVPPDVKIPFVHAQAADVHPVQQIQTQTGDIVAANFTAEVNQELPQKSTAVSGNLSSNLGRQLWRAGISAYEGQMDNKSKTELKRLIEQIHSVEFKPPKQAPEPIITIEPTATTLEPNETPSDAEAKQKIDKMTIESKLPYEPVTDRTMQILGNIAKDPNQLDNPFGLAEVLYFSGRVKEAAVLYQEALNRMGKDKTASGQNRAWILFQLGNCLRNYDLPTAKKMYVQLITEFPESQWVEPAKAREKLIDWYLKDKPKTLLAKPKS
jgi:tetratricopeptide (TPR) repeat protein